jgi:hypothetical protein
MLGKLACSVLRGAKRRQALTSPDGTVVVWQMGAGSFISFPVALRSRNILDFPDTLLVNPPLQAFLYKTDASGHDIAVCT